MEQLWWATGIQPDSTHCIQVVFFWQCYRCNQCHTEQGKKSCEEVPCFSALRGHTLFFLNLSSKWIPTFETYTWVRKFNVLWLCILIFCLINRKKEDVSGKASQLLGLFFYSMKICLVSLQFSLKHLKFRTVNVMFIGYMF